MSSTKKSKSKQSKTPGSPGSALPTSSLSSLIQATTKLAIATSSSSSTRGDQTFNLRTSDTFSISGTSGVSSSADVSTSGTSGGISAGSGGSGAEGGQINHSKKRVWVDSALVVFKVLKDVSEASELLGPLKVVSGLMITVLEGAQASMKNAEAWEALRATLERHRSLLARHFERVEQEGGNQKADSNLTEILLDYGDTLEDVLVCVLKEMGISEEDIPPSTGTTLKRKLGKVGLTGLEAERIKAYSDRLSSALQHMMTALQIHTAVEISRIHDKLDKGPQRQKLFKKALLVFKALKEVSKKVTVLETFRELVSALPSVIELLDLDDEEYSIWPNIASTFLEHQTTLEGLVVKLERADLAEDPQSPIPSYVSHYISEIESALSIFVFRHGMTRRDIPRELSHIQVLVDKGLNGMILSNIRPVLASCLDKIKASLHSIPLILDVYIPEMNDTLSRLGRPSVFSVGTTGFGIINPQGTHHQRCLPGTRVALLQQIDEWMKRSIKEQRIYVLGDVAGTGKSTIACEMAHRWEEEQLLASRFFFSCGNSGTSTATDLCIHLAKDLSTRFPHLNDQLTKALEEVGEMFQFEKIWQSLALEPLSQITEKTVVVIDGLDECTQTSREDFLGALLRDFGDSNSFVHFFITTRLEEEIIGLLQRRRDVILARIQQTEQQRRANVRDVARYIEVEFEKMRNPSMSHQSAQRLLERAGGLFIFASTICAVLAKSFERQRLFDDILNFKGFTNLDGLYLGILQRVLPNDPFSRRALNDVLSVILAAQEPLSISALQACCPNVSSVRGIVEMLGSVLSIGPGSEQGDDETFVFIIHQTFRDFLLQKRRSEDYALSIHSGHSALVDSCFKTLSRELRTGMSATVSASGNLSLDTHPEEISGLLRAKSHPLLCYSAIHWISHSIPVLHLQSTRDEIRQLFLAKLTSWVEVAALLRGLASMMIALRRMHDVMKRYGGLPNHQFTNADLQWCLETISLIQNNQLLLESCPWQIYISPLIFLDEDALISQQYRDRRLPITRKAATPLSSALYNFSLNWGDPITLRGHRTSVNCVDWSVDGKTIASGSNDHKVILWDALTGAMLRILHGHTGPVLCVKFSRSGDEVVSSSEDGTIRWWKRGDGSCIGDPWRIVEGYAPCFTFSFDSRDLVYGTTTGLVCRVDAETGALIETPQRAHAEKINAISISYDGAHMVTASEDHYLHIWFWTTRDKPLELSQSRRHPHPILSATFIPNSTMIAYTSFGLYTCSIFDLSVETVQKDEELQHTCVAASSDVETLLTGSLMQTIWTWKTGIVDGATGKIRHGELAYAQVQCLAYGPDGRSFVSGSSDSTLKIWPTDFPSMPAIASVSMERPSLLMMVAFSHDGSLLAAVGSDGAFKIWEVESGKLRLGPVPTGSPLAAVAFHPNGRFLACGKTLSDISLWSTTDGGALRRNFLSEGGPKPLYTMQFSPNGQLFATADHHSNISLWSLDMNLTISPMPITSLRFNSAGPNLMAFDLAQRFLAYRNQVWDLAQSPPVQVPEEYCEGIIAQVVNTPLRYDDFSDKKYGRRWIQVGAPLRMSVALPLDFDARRHAIHGTRMALGAKLGEAMVLDFGPVFDKR
ncbi:hypothetical protein FRC17_011063 [Serendipita sp. 399]|nr:hypothetical protein FRC17_011063 [Serendipita sp. 399]